MEEERNRNNYGLLDLRQLMAGTGRTCFPDSTTPQVSEPFITSSSSSLLGCHTGEALLLAHEFGGHNNNNNNNNNSSCVVAVTPPPPPPPSVSAAAHHHHHNHPQFGGLEIESGCNINGDGGRSRWPRQETLSLLEIRSRLDYKFKETNQKGPLWDEVSRILWEEHGYQRSGRKCREKFENLYKYYKKTKEGKAGRQDGKHYRFFRQLEALCGEPIHESSDTHLAKYNNLLYPNPTTNSFIFDQENQEASQDHKVRESHTRSNSSEFETSSSINNGDDDLSAIALMLKHSKEKKTRSNESKSFRKVMKFVDLRMKKFMDTQEAWMDKMLKTVEQKEEERTIREEEWRKEKTARLDQEFKFWANERAWIEARDNALLDALQKFTRKELKVSLPDIRDRDIDMEDDATELVPNNTNRSTGWIEPEILSFIQLRTSMEPRFQESRSSKEWLWEEIVARMACLGYDWSVIRCKETWENISFNFNKTMECEKKDSVQNSKTCNYFQQFSSYHGQEIAEQNNDGLSTCSSKIGNAVHENSFPILMINEKGTMWENYGVKFSKD